MNKRRRYFKEDIKNHDSQQDYVEVEDEKIRRKRDLFAYISESLSFEEEIIKTSKYQPNTVVIEEEFVSSILQSSSSEEEALKKTLQEKLNCLLAWNAHYDYDLWNMVEEHFSFLWLELEHEMYLGVEYGLYEEVKNLFFELRNFFQGTGRIKERIFFAAWLRREAKSQGDLAMMCFATSSLVWSYTSSGCYQNLEKAYELWDKLTFYVLPKEPLVVCDDGKSIQETLGSSLYAELLMEVHENGVRLAIRQRDFDKACLRIEKGKNTIEELFDKKFISLRLKERFSLAFKYHKGIVFCLMQKHKEAEQVFSKISKKAKILGWNRIVKGAKSWLATLAMEREDYRKCENILEDISTKNIQGIPDKRDGFCYLIKSQNFNKAGQKEQAKESEEIAIKIFQEYSNNDLSSGLKSLVLLSSRK